ncbi:hypothetical protein JI739_20730 [Ramlibacter sp. AW1]|uniref:Uncharacterized protein n=1 Tax=Ramlibacter aurantiacus TaxID=2801330 RepID=A0A936ZM90_9BURK|nr:hypothetical protein [Ramlibacter aurantiacus]
MVVDFEARPVRALAARLMGSGQAMPRARVRLRISGRELQAETGLHGELYLEGVPPGRHAGQSEDGGLRCRFELTVPVQSEVLFDAGDLWCGPS